MYVDHSNCHTNIYSIYTCTGIHVHVLYTYMYSCMYEYQITKVYSRSPCTREISHNFAMMPPISKFQRPADCALQVGSKYTVYILFIYTVMEIAVCPISVVRTVRVKKKRTVVPVATGKGSGTSAVPARYISGTCEVHQRYLRGTSAGLARYISSTCEVYQQYL